MYEHITDQNEAQVLVDQTRRAVEPKQLADGQLYGVFDAAGNFSLVKTPAYQRLLDAEPPVRIQASRRVRDVKSFLEYLGTHVTAGDKEGQIGELPLLGKGLLEVWADEPMLKVTAVINGGDGWCDHTCTLALRKSDTWAEWMSIDGKLLPQDEFAEFIEDHLSSIGEPDGATLLDICQTLQANTGVVFKSQQILANGQRQLVYEETVDAKAGAKGDLKIPSELTLVVAPFDGAAPQPVKARFRFRITAGRLTIGVKLVEPAAVIERAFTNVVDDISARLVRPVYFGSLA